MVVCNNVRAIVSTIKAVFYHTNKQEQCAKALKYNSNMIAYANITRVYSISVHASLLLL